MTNNYHQNLEMDYGSLRKTWKDMNPLCLVRTSEVKLHIF
jgi:hypothetical protein